jgi:hypothetical protein
VDIRLTTEQKAVITEVVERFEWDTNITFETQPACVVLKSMTEDEADDLRDLCSDYLLEVGFDDDYAANDKGVLLEQLIDKLFIE